MSVAVFDISLGGDSDEFFLPGSTLNQTFTSSKFVDVEVFLQKAQECFDLLIIHLQVGDISAIRDIPTNCVIKSVRFILEK